MLAKELHINDGVVAPRERIIEVLETKKERMRFVHDALRFGDEEIGLPGADNRAAEMNQLLYDEGCLLTDSELCNEEIVVPQVAVRQGLHNALLYFWEQVRPQIDLRREPANIIVAPPSSGCQVEEILHAAKSTSTPPPPSYHIAAMRRNSSQLSFVMDSMHYDITDALHNAGEYFVGAAEDAQTSASTAVLLALLTNLLILLLTYGT